MVITWSILTPASTWWSLARLLNRSAAPVGSLQRGKEAGENHNGHGCRRCEDKDAQVQTEIGREWQRGRDQRGYGIEQQVGLEDAGNATQKAQDQAFGEHN
jgi:hypothetical protein